MDHGSRRAASNALFLEFAEQYAVATSAPIVEPCHMELCAPTIKEAFDRCVARGATSVVVAPYFFYPGRHVMSDIPQLVAEAASAHPGVTWRIAAPVGQDARMVDIVHDKVLDSLFARGQDVPRDVGE